jgi:hypothetical protein
MSGENDSREQGEAEDLDKSGVVEEKLLLLLG